MPERNHFCRDAAHVDIERTLAEVTRDRDEARADLADQDRRAVQLFETLREVLGHFAPIGLSGSGTGWLPAADLARWRAVLDADPDDPAPTPAPDRPDLLGAVAQLTEAVSALQQAVTADAPPLPAWEERLLDEQAALIAARNWVEANRGHMLDDADRRANVEDIALIDAIDALDRAEPVGQQPARIGCWPPLPDRVE